MSSRIVPLWLSPKIELSWNKSWLNDLAVKTESESILIQNSGVALLSRHRRLEASNCALRCWLLCENSHDLWPLLFVGRWRSVPSPQKSYSMHGNGYTGSMECFPKFMSPSFLSSFYHNYLPLNHRKSREALPPLEEWSACNGLSPFRLSLFFSMTISRRWVEELGAITALLLETSKLVARFIKHSGEHWQSPQSPDSAHVRNSKPWRSRRRHQFGHHG